MNWISRLLKPKAQKGNPVAKEFWENHDQWMYHLDECIKASKALEFDRADFHRQKADELYSYSKKYLEPKMLNP